MTIIPSGANATIDTLVKEESQHIDNKHIWIHLSEQIDWEKKGSGFIYRNFRGAKKTRIEALEHLYSVLNFSGGEWKLEKSEPDYVSYTRDNGREYIIKYNLEGPTFFDCNH